MIVITINRGPIDATWYFIFPLVIFDLYFLAHQDDGDVEQQEELGQLAFDFDVLHLTNHLLSHITGCLLS